MRKKRSNTLLSRIGTIGYNNYGSRMIIVEYLDTNNIMVKFEKGELIHANWYNFCKGNIRNPYDKTVYGIGCLGEGEYETTQNGKNTHSYKTWNGMLQRCYTEKYHQIQPTYKGCSVSEEWLNYQNFASWYKDNYYTLEGEVMCLDKDIVIKRNKIYSPESCVFVPQRINGLFVKTNSKRGCLPIGVSLTRNNTFVARCQMGKGKVKHLGVYKTHEEAFITYKLYKEKLIKQIAEEYKNKIPDKLYEAMRTYIVEITD